LGASRGLLPPVEDAQLLEPVQEVAGDSLDLGTLGFAQLGHGAREDVQDDRGSPGCQRIDARPDRLRQSLEGSRIHTDRIEFTAMNHAGRWCYGRVVLVPLLSTPPCGDAVAVQFRTALRRPGADFHRSIFPPSQAHGWGERRPRAVALSKRCSFVTLTSRVPKREATWWPSPGREGEGLYPKGRHCRRHLRAPPE